MTISIAQSADVGKLIDAFKDVNPNYQRFFARRNQRDAAARMLEKYPLGLLLKVVALLPKSNRQRYFPTVTTPIQLEEKYSALEAAFIKENAKQKSNLPTVAKIR